MIKKMYCTQQEGTTVHTSKIMVLCPGQWSEKKVAALVRYIFFLILIENFDSRFLSLDHNLSCADRSERFLSSCKETEVKH